MASLDELKSQQQMQFQQAQLFNMQAKKATPNYQMAIKKDIDSINNMYTNSRYSPIGTDEVGTPFPAFREFGGRMTQWAPVALDSSTLRKTMNLPTDTTTARNSLQKDAISTGNDGLKNWLYGVQTLANLSTTNFCTSNSDCAPYGPNYKCNSNYESWPDSYGNQSGSTCSLTKYPELDGGKYIRKDAYSGGIGKNCSTDNDCGDGYECNNTTDMFGKNLQQSGYCSIPFSCPDNKKRFLGTPANSGLPVVPPKNQNNGGMGYKTKQECQENALATQDCVQGGETGNYYALFPGTCPTFPSNRIGGAAGALRQSTASQKENGFSIPSYANFKSSTFGSNSKPVRSLYNVASKANAAQQNSPLMYSLSINPKPSNA